MQPLDALAGRVAADASRRLVNSAMPDAPRQAPYQASRRRVPPAIASTLRRLADRLDPLDAYPAPR